MEEGHREEVSARSVGVHGSPGRFDGINNLKHRENACRSQVLSTLTTALDSRCEGGDASSDDEWLRLDTRALCILIAQS